MSKRTRQYIGILAAVVAYYVIHEGAHLLYAIAFGVFKQMNFIGLGIQIDIYAENLTNTQLGLFCLAGPFAALVAGYLLTLFAEKICEVKSKLFRAVTYYITIALLLIDPLYLCLLCVLFGGGDMNGISLLCSRWAARCFFGVLLLVNGFLFAKRILPVYKKSFSSNSNSLHGM